MTAQLAGAVRPADVEHAEGIKNPTVRLVGVILAFVIPAILWYAPLGIEPKAQQALAITAFMIISWMTEWIDHALAGFFGCYMFWALRVAPFEEAFSGFANDTPWFLMGALLIGAMASKTGLARRIAYLVMLRAGNSYAGILFGLVVTDFLLTIIVPSGIARVVIMLAVAVGLLDVYGMRQPGSNIGRGMFLILTYSATIFDKMIIAGAAAITARGAIERFGGVEVLWSKWLLAYLPCDILTIVAAWWLTLKMWPPERKTLEGGPEFIRAELTKMGPWTSGEKRCLALLLVALGLWTTDFLHHLSPSLIGLGVGLIATLPRVGILNADDAKKINYFPIFFVAAALSMGNVLVDTKALDVLTDFMFEWMTPYVTSVYSSTLVLYWTAFVYHIFLASEISMLSTSIPLLMDFAKTHMLDPLALGMIWTFAAGGKILVYQNAVLIVGFGYGYFTAKDMLKMGFALSVVQSIILVFLVPIYWPLIGIG